MKPKDGASKAALVTEAIERTLIAVSTTRCTSLSRTTRKDLIGSLDFVSHEHTAHEVYLMFGAFVIPNPR